MIVIALDARNPPKGSIVCNFIGNALFRAGVNYFKLRKQHLMLAMQNQLLQQLF